MEQPKVTKGTWIKIKSDENSPGIDGYVFDIFSNGTISIGYYQNNRQAIKEEVIWAGSYWKFKYEGPCGSYLRGSDAAIVRRGPE